MTPRGIRNNNPLNIKYVEGNRWKGRVPKKQKKDKTFEEFTSMEYGIRAAIKLINKYIRDGYDTPRKIIDRWCPPIAENNGTNEVYHKFVDNRLRMMSGIDWNEDDTIKVGEFYKIFGLLKAMARMESHYDLELQFFMDVWAMK